MHDRRLDDIGPPFEPATPEEFMAQCTMAFQGWWDELDPPGICDRIELDYSTARMVWQSAYEYRTFAIELVYESARAHDGRGATVRELYLGYVVDRFHGGSAAFSTRDFVDWLAIHEDDHCTCLDKDETVHICIKSRCDEPIPKDPSRTASHARRSTPDELLASESQSFMQWWDELDPPSSYEGRSLVWDETRVVWLAACEQLWDDLEAIHECAHAHSDVASTTAGHELAYIVDKQHHGKLTFSLDDLIDWSDKYQDKIRRRRNEDSIAVWIEHPD